MKGIIDQIWENESKNGNKYLTVEIGGERYSVWDTKYFDVLREGAWIEYDVKQSGNFKHLTEIKPTEESGVPVYRPNNKEKQITRLSCLRSASEILAAVPMDNEAKRELVIDTARYFERYVFDEGPDEPSDDIPW